MKKNESDYFEKYLDEKFDNINSQLKKMNDELCKKASKKDVEELKGEIGNIKLTASIVGGIGGLLTAVGSYFAFFRR